MSKRVALLIDGVFLFHGLNGRTLNFKSFKEWIIKDDNIVFAGYFNSINNKFKKQRFFDHLQASGFTLYIRNTFYNRELARNVLFNITSDMIAEGCSIINMVDKLIIVSSKPELLSVIEKFRLSGKEVEIIRYKDINHNLFDHLQTRYIENYFYTL